MKNGSKFEFGSNSDDLFDVFDPDDDFYSDDEEKETPKDIRVQNIIGTPFASIKLNMEEIENRIFKQVLKPGTGDLVGVNSKVKVHYSLFFENKHEPFESTFVHKRPVEIVLGEGFPVGKVLCIWTMQEGEEAQFIVPYQLLFGEMGQGELIPPKADGLYIIRLLSFEDVGNDEAITEEYINEQDSYQNVLLRVVVTRQHARYCFKEGEFRKAKQNFAKCLRALQNCTVLTDEDEKDLMQNLGQLYVNIAVCYNKLEKPKKVLQITEDLKKINMFDNNCKALFQHGRALESMGEYENALEYLDKALKIEPNNKEIIQEIRKVYDNEKFYKNSMKSICQKAMGFNPNAHRHQMGKDDPIEKMVKKFVDNANIKQKALPLTLTRKEEDHLRHVCQSYKVTVTVTFNEDSRLVLTKAE